MEYIDNTFWGKSVTWMLVFLFFLIWLLGVMSFIKIMQGHDIFDLLFIWMSWGITKQFVKWLWGKINKRVKNEEKTNAT